MNPQQIIQLIAAYNYMLAIERSGMARPGSARAWADSSLDPKQHDVVLDYIKECEAFAASVRNGLSATFQWGGGR